MFVQLHDPMLQDISSLVGALAPDQVVINWILIYTSWFIFVCKAVPSYQLSTKNQKLTRYKLILYHFIGLLRALLRDVLCNRISGSYCGRYKLATNTKWTLDYFLSIDQLTLDLHFIRIFLEMNKHLHISVTTEIFTLFCS